MKAGIITGIILAIAAIVICFVPLMNAAYIVAVEYQDTETYYEDEPYETTETYTENVPLDYEVIKVYTEDDVFTERQSVVIGGIVFQDEVVETPIKVACVTVKNTDSPDSSFKVTFSVAKALFSELPKDVSLVLSSGESKTAKYPAEKLGDWSYTVTPGTKPVEAEKTVTKYRQVEKQRTVTKQRQETCYKKITLLDYLLLH